MAATLYNGLDTAPGMLADAVNTQLNASFVSGTNLANHLVAHARGVVPAGLPNAILSGGEFTGAPPGGKRGLA